MGRAKGTHCRRGHEFTDANTGVSGGYRYCRTCRRASRTPQPLDELTLRRLRAQVGLPPEGPPIRQQHRGAMPGRKGRRALTETTIDRLTGARAYLAGLGVDPGAPRWPRGTGVRLRAHLGLTDSQYNYLTTLLREANND